MASERALYKIRTKMLSRISLLNDILRGLDGSEHVYGFFLDFPTKAFDAVNNALLLQKLKLIGFRDNF